MLTSSNLAQAQAIIDRGVASDGTFPTQTVWLAKTSDWPATSGIWNLTTRFSTRAWPAIFPLRGPIQIRPTV
jgi:hypothetical protein